VSAQSAGEYVQSDLSAVSTEASTCDQLGVDGDGRDEPGTEPAALLRDDAPKQFPRGDGSGAHKTKIEVARGAPSQLANQRRGSAARTRTSGNPSSRRTMLVPSTRATHL
jgi:hypothetical protein